MCPARFRTHHHMLKCAFQQCLACGLAHSIARMCCLSTATGVAVMFCKAPCTPCLHHTPMTPISNCQQLTRCSAACHTSFFSLTFMPLSVLSRVLSQCGGCVKFVSWWVVLPFGVPTSCSCSVGVTRLQNASCASGVLRVTDQVHLSVSLAEST